jgi:hypothetical protein
VRDPQRERAHRRDALGAQELFVALALRLGHRERSQQLELLALSSQGRAAEDDDEPGRQEHAQQQTPHGSLLAVALPRCRRHGDHAPSPALPDVDAGDASHRGALGQAHVRGLGARQSERGQPPRDGVFEGRGPDHVPAEPA